MQVQVLVDLLHIIFINLILSADSALIIGIAIRDLRSKQRKQVLIWSTFGISFIYIIFAIFASLIINIPYLKLGSGILLIWIAAKLIIDYNHSRSHITSVRSAIKQVLLTNLIISLDNILAISALTRGNLLLIFLGVLISVSLLVWTSSFFATIVGKFPIIIYGGAGTLIYISTVMILEDLSFISHKNSLVPFICLLVTIFILLSLEIYRKRIR
jgi:YjbE family integral membrane protein